MSFVIPCGFDTGVKRQHARRPSVIPRDRQQVFYILNFYAQQLCCLIGILHGLLDQAHGGRATFHGSLPKLRCRHSALRKAQGVLCV